MIAFENARLKGAKEERVESWKRAGRRKDETAATLVNGEGGMQRGRREEVIGEEFMMCAVRRARDADQGCRKRKGISRESASTRSCIAGLFPHSFPSSQNGFWFFVSSSKFWQRRNVR